MTSTELSFDALQDAVENMPDDSLTASRRAALEHLRDHGLPTTRHEDWKYTDLSKVIDIGNRSLGRESGYAPSAQLDGLIKRISASIAADWLVISDGRIDDESIGSVDCSGVTISRLAESASEIDFTAPLSDLNTALLHDGLRIQVATGTELSRPIGFLVIGCIIAAVIAFAGFGRDLHRTWRGDRALNRLREKNATLESSESVMGKDLALCVALFGIGFLAGDTQHR